MVYRDTTQGFEFDYSIAKRLSGAKMKKKNECQTVLYSQCIMDFPSAWEFVAKTKLTSHHKKCSYRTENRSFLCDCEVLDKEYNRRKKAIENRRK
jgi:hypothetical protein